LQLSIQIEEAIALSIDKVEPYKQKWSKLFNTFTNNTNEKKQ
jgi:hypothetical protein